MNHHHYPATLKVSAFQNARALKKLGWFLCEFITQEDAVGQKLDAGRAQEDATNDGSYQYLGLSTNMDEIETFNCTCPAEAHDDLNALEEYFPAPKAIEDLQQTLIAISGYWDRHSEVGKKSIPKVPKILCLREEDVRLVESLMPSGSDREIGSHYEQCFLFVLKHKIRFALTAE